MPVDYVSPDEMRRTWVTQLSTSDEPAMAWVCTAASRFVDDWCNRRFYTTTGDETRSFDVPMRYDRRIPWNGLYFGWQTFEPGLDLAAITTLQIAESTIKATSGTFATISTGDYFLQPADRADGWPAQYISLTDEFSGTYNSSAPFGWFMPGYRNVQIVGKFGWNSTTPDSTNFPQEIRLVTAEVATWLWRTRESGFSNSVNVSDLGTVSIPRALSPWSREVLEKYRRATAR